MSQRKETEKKLLELICSTKHRNTKAKLMVLKVIDYSSDVVSVDEIWYALSKAKIKVSRATVYNCVNLFLANGLIERLPLNETREAFKYKITKTTYYENFKCSGCGSATILGYCTNGCDD